MSRPSEPRTPPDAIKALAVVPARLGSKRLPRKMLLRETGRYLFQHTVENLRRSQTLERVVLATDAEEIVAAAGQVGVDVVLTAESHPSGTDRVHEAWQRLSERGEGPWDVVVNVQGDEPELPLEDVEHLLGAFRDPAVELATLGAPIEREEEARDPSVVKVVSDRVGDALYFSRSTVPSLDHPSRPARDGALDWRGIRRHVGVYAFRPEALARFCGLPVGRLEATENLEQLRWLEAGRRMRVVEAVRPTIGIDTREHYEAFVSRTTPRPALEGA